MIEIRYLQAESGANKFGTCNCCGKSSGEDPLMISVKFSYYGHGTLICLCNDCKKKLIEALPLANNSETPNSSDCISRQAAIDCVMECYDNDELFEVYEDRLNELPPAQPGIIRCKDCRFSDSDATCCLVCCRDGQGLKFAHVRADNFCSYAERKTE